MIVLSDFLNCYAIINDKYGLTEHPCFMGLLGKMLFNRVGFGNSNKLYI